MIKEKSVGAQNHIRTALGRLHSVQMLAAGRR
jgi:hypothetical protein